MPTLQYGSVVWLNVRDQRGHEKKRPVVVLSATEEILPAATLYGVAVSTTQAIPLPPEHVELPWSRLPGGHPRTGLRARCWAICPWVVRFATEDVESIAGVVPGKHLQEIQSHLARLLAGTDPPPSETTN